MKRGEKLYGCGLVVRKVGRKIIILLTLLNELIIAFEYNLIFHDGIYQVIDCGIERIYFIPAQL